MATTVEQRSSLPVVPGAIPASSCTKLAIAVNCTQLAAAVWYVAPPVTFPVVYIRKRSGCVVANLLWLCVVSLGHLKKIISFSSSWFRNLNATGGNLILSIYCASYIQTT